MSKLLRNVQRISARDGGFWRWRLFRHRFFTVPHYSLFKPLALSIPKENLELSYEGFYTKVLKMTAPPPPLFKLNINHQYFFSILFFRSVSCLFFIYLLFFYVYSWKISKEKQRLRRGVIQILCRYFISVIFY